MTTSSIIIDYLGEGAAAARPVSLTISSAALGLYYATDTHVLSLWNGASWDVFTAGATTVDTGSGLTGGPFSSSGTVSLADIAAARFLANTGTASAAPIATAFGTLTAGTGLTGGPFTAVAGGTLSFASIAAGDLLANAGTVSAAPTATAFGTLTAGTGLSGGPFTPVAGGTIALVAATTSALGGVIVGSGATINGGGTLSIPVSGVTSFGGDTGSITIGLGLLESGNTLSNAGVVALQSSAGSITLGSGLAMAANVLSVDAIAAARFLANTGTVSAAPVATAFATITAGAGLSGGPFTTASGGTFSNAGVLAVGATAGSIVLGSGIGISGQTLSATGSGGTVTSVAAGTGLNVGAGPGGTITGAGTLNVAAATTAALGGVIVGPGLSVSAGTITPNSAARVLIDQGTVAASGTSTISTDCSTGNVFTNTMTANATLANPSNVLAGASYLWVINSGTTGTLTLSYGSSFVFNSPYTNASPPAIGAGVNILTCVASGTATLHSVLQAGTWA